MSLFSAPSPIERYVRCSVLRGDWIIEPGLEWREGDNFDDLSSRLRCLVADMPVNGDPMEAARRSEPTFQAMWPGRAFFVEVHDAHGDRWTQIFQPYGVPRR